MIGIEHYSMSVTDIFVISFVIKFGGYTTSIQHLRVFIIYLTTTREQQQKSYMSFYFICQKTRHKNNQILACLYYFISQKITTKTINFLHVFII